MADLSSRLKAGGRVAGNIDSDGSSLMITWLSKRSSVTVAGLSVASIEPRDSTSDGAGVYALYLG